MHTAAFPTSSQDIPVSLAVAPWTGEQLEAAIRLMPAITALRDRQGTFALTNEMSMPSASIATGMAPAEPWITELVSLPGLGWEWLKP